MNRSIFSDPEQGYFVQPQRAASDILVSHAIGGVASECCRCAHCEELLVTLLQLNTSDSRLTLEKVPVPMLPLICCPKCFTEPMAYTFTSAGEILVNERSARVEFRSDHGIRIDQIETQTALLHAIPERIAEVRLLACEGRLAEAEEWVAGYDWDRPHDQVGGRPHLRCRSMQNPKCELCGRVMPFLASSLVDVQLGFESDEHELQLLFFLCRGCMSVSVLPDLPERNYS